MEIIDLNDYEEKKYKTAVALGNFDGVHIGHRYLIQKMIEKANKKELKSSVLLFKNHTKNALTKKNNNDFNIITSNDQKISILKDLGVEIVYTLSFNKSTRRLTREEFIEKIIIRKLNSKMVTVGFDYKFGYKAKGDSHYLKEIGSKKDFFVNIINPIYLEENVVSSTIIRELIKTGNVKKANKFLGSSYKIEGIVVEGKKRGRKLGFPTANIKLNNNYILPKLGVYKTNTSLNNKKHSSITNIGYNPTFKDNKFKIETHILNFNGHIYGKTIEVEFIDFLREDIEFDTIEELINQIEKDIFIY